MSRQDTDKDQGLTPAEEKKAQDAAKAAGRSEPDATDRRDAIKSQEQGDDRPKNSGNTNQTGSQEEKKNHQGPKEH